MRRPVFAPLRPMFRGQSRSKKTCQHGVLAYMFDHRRKRSERWRCVSARSTSQDQSCRSSRQQCHFFVFVIHSIAVAVCRPIHVAGAPVGQGSSMVGRCCHEFLRRQNIRLSPKLLACHTTAQHAIHCMRAMTNAESEIEQSSVAGLQRPSSCSTVGLALHAIYGALGLW